MTEADVGDDGYGEDPTVRRLEETFAARLGKPAALFVPSGTMGNQIALRLLSRPGSTIVVGRRQHVVVYEMGAAGVNSTSQLTLVDDDDGVLSAEGIRFEMAAGRLEALPVAAVFVENTHMPAGGRPWTIEELRSISSLGLPVHLDGARLFNAEVATGTSAADYAAEATTVMCCLSKGLGAPVGSMLAADAGLIEAARLERKRLGGAMRQAGVIAAAGLVAMENVDRLADDHARARRLAAAVAARWPEAGLEPGDVQTNVVVFRHGDVRGLLVHLREAGVLAGPIAPGIVRLMTHLDVDDAGVDRACRALADAP